MKALMRRGFKDHGKEFSERGSSSPMPRNSVSDFDLLRDRQRFFSVHLVNNCNSLLSDQSQCQQKRSCFVRSASTVPMLFTMMLLLAVNLGPSKPSVYRAICEVTSAINIKLSHRIKWPSDEGECRRIASSFFRLANPGMPTVCGAVDGSLIKLAHCPSEHESQFVDRHQQHSINAMAVAGPDYRFYSLSAKWPGSVNAARVLRNSSLATQFSDGWRPFPGAVLLGDSIYGASDWLVPMRPHAHSSMMYSTGILIVHSVCCYQLLRCHSKTRRVVECAFGLWKNRFQCLKSGMRLKSPTYCGEVIMACEHLHNFLVEERLEQENDDDDYMEADEEPGDEEEQQEEDNNVGDSRLPVIYQSFCAVNMFVMAFAEKNYAECRKKEQDKYALFKKIQANKDTLFGKFSESITKQLKDDTWETIRKELVAEGYSSSKTKLQSN
uniref:Regulatory protein zeste n=1 Tax=Ditylenchus dipsaci TaxID=166011 RepID=A0A915EBG5_9BILA